MTGETQLHETTTSLVIVPPAELDAGSEFALKVRVSCAVGCDLARQFVRIIDQNGALVKEIELPSSEETSPSAKNIPDKDPSEALVADTDEFAVKAPLKPGEYAWTALFPAQERDGVRHNESSALFSFLVKPHPTSMTIWDIPSPVVLGARFKIKAGVLCSVGCKLTGEKIEVFDEQGANVGTGLLSEEPWSYRGPLYWAEVELQAPTAKGVYEWNVRFSRSDRELAPREALEHLESAYPFAFAAASAPDHVVKLEVIDKQERTPVANADVALFQKNGFPYRTRTDAAGMATWNVPKGHYSVLVALMDYKDFKTTAEVDSDLTLKAEIVYDPDLGG